MRVARRESAAASAPASAVVPFESLSETKHGVFAETDAFIECDGFQVLAADLEIDLRAAKTLKSVLDFRHEYATESPPLEQRINREIVDPTAVTVVASHDAGDEFVLDFADEKQLALNLPLASDVLVGIIPGPKQSAARPERHDSILIEVFEWQDLHATSGLQSINCPPATASTPTRATQICVTCTCSADSTWSCPTP